MKLKDCTPEQRAWEIFKCITFNSIMVAFGLGALTIIFLRDNYFVMLLILISPICYFIGWKILSKDFLKKGVKP